ncbi:SH3 domain-containing protein PJ696,02 [Talaromyces islandicus]|uniref:SH3 domain-containing protein PJ696,02 n=1 Tax=Talaromyces islandicus TaxID=28573 RepID=A0A0U1LPH7_TALIS|nr:SH3 domain-containing protein PJ696,02 [Talaromyces islandicus]
MPQGIHNPFSTSLQSDCKKAIKILESFINVDNPSSTTKAILRDAQGLIIFTAFKAGFLGSARYGSGLLVARLDDGSWSPPSSITIGGVGFGGQIGVEFTDFVFALPDRSSIRTFCQIGSLTLGANASLALGPAGRSGEAGLGANWRGVGSMLTLSKTNGLFGGISVEAGTFIEGRMSNKKFYKYKVTAAQILSGEVEPPLEADALLRTLAAIEFRSSRQQSRVSNSPQQSIKQPHPGTVEMSAGPESQQASELSASEAPRQLPSELQGQYDHLAQAVELLQSQAGSHGYHEPHDAAIELPGNVQVDAAYLGAAQDHTVNPKREEDLLARWKAWAAVCTQNGTPTVMQINHPGRQSPLGAGSRSIFSKTIAPSCVSMNLGNGLIARAASAIVFGCPREMTQTDIDNVIQQFAHTSRLAAKAGFQGVEIHAAHGYLLAQFLSAHTNRRTDSYGNSAAGRAKIVVEVIKAIRGSVSDKGFCVGIKLNSVDHQSAKELKECVEQLKLIVEAGVDFVEVSGGTYENTTMFQDISSPPSEKSARTVAREAFFLEFAETIRDEFPDTPLMVTGGFRTRNGITKAVEDGACDMVGIGRPAVLNPALPKEVLFNPAVSEENSRLVTRSVTPSRLASWTGIKTLGSGAETLWYSKQMRNVPSVI